MLFEYQAFTADGDVKRGQLNSASKASCLSQLLDQKLTPIEIELIGESTDLGEDFTPGPRLPTNPTLNGAELLELTRELDLLLTSGMSPSASIEVLADSLDGNQAAVSKALLNAVRSGLRLSEAMESVLGKQLPNYYSSTLQAGESIGAIDSAISALRDRMERHEKLRQQLFGQLVYPMLLLAMAITTLCIVVLWILPLFAGFFDDANVPTPPWLSFILETRFVVLALACMIPLIVACFFAAVYKVVDGRQVPIALERIILFLPWCKSVVLQLEWARYGDIIAMLLRSGASLRHSAHLAAEGVCLSVLRSRLTQIVDRILSGYTYSEALQSIDSAPKLLVRLTRAAESADALANAISLASKAGSEHANRQIRTSIASIVPTVILFTAVIVAGLLGAVVLSMLEFNAIALDV